MNIKTDSYYLDRIREAIQEGEPSISRMRQPFQVGDGEMWFYDGFVSMFSTLHEALRTVDDSSPPALPHFLLEPTTLARVFGLPLEKFTWQGVGSAVPFAAGGTIFGHRSHCCHCE